MRIPADEPPPPPAPPPPTEDELDLDREIEYAFDTEEPMSGRAARGRRGVDVVSGFSRTCNVGPVSPSPSGFGGTGPLLTPGQSALFGSVDTNVDLTARLLEHDDSRYLSRLPSTAFLDIAVMHFANSYGRQSEGTDAVKSRNPFSRASFENFRCRAGGTFRPAGRGFSTALSMVCPQATS